MITPRFLLILGSLVWQAQAQIIPPAPAEPISCGANVNGVLLALGVSSYEFTATSDGIIEPWTCGFTDADTAITVEVGGVVVAESDDLGPIVCPGNPRASGVTVRITTGTTYLITVSPGAAWTGGDDNAFSLDLYCNGGIESYWETMFNNSGYTWSLFAVVNGIWYYDGVSTCVGKGYYFGICPFHHAHCSGYSTYGWGSGQVQDVLLALAQPNGKHPDFSTGCPGDLTCTEAQYTCINQNCVSLSQLCDDTDDCGDGSDEDVELTRDLCGSECTSHAGCPNGYCNTTNQCVFPCGSCTNETAPIGGSCPGCFCTINGCMDPLAVNYDDMADCDDGSCEFCFDGVPSLHLETDFPAGLNAGRCGLEANGDLKVSCHTSQKYPTSIVSLLSPITGAQPFSTTFNEQGRNPTTSPVYWTHSQGPVCDNTYDGIFAWDDVLTNDDSTVLIRTDFPASVIFTGWIAVDMYEQLDPLRDVNLTRWVRQKLPFRVVYETDVTAISTVLKVHHDWNVFFAIIDQKTIVVNSTVSPPGIEADIVLWSSIEHPFRLVQPVVSVDVPALSNAGLTVALMEDCMPGAGEPCNQKFLIHVDLEEECYFSGQYTVDFEIECLPAVDSPDCPLNSSLHTETVVFDIETEYVCPTMIFNVVSTGSVKSYQSPRIGTAPYQAPEHRAFMVNNWAYFEVTMASVEGLIVGTTITRIELCFDVNCNNPTLAYDNGVATIADIQLSVEDYPRVAPSASPLPLNSDFEMYLNSSVFNVPVDSNIDFYLIIEVDIEYFNTQTLLEEDEERDMKMATAEKLRTRRRTKMLLETTEAEHQGATTTGSASVGVGPQVIPQEDAVTDVTVTVGAASTVRATLASFAAVAITLALW